MKHRVSVNDVERLVISVLHMVILERDDYLVTHLTGRAGYQNLHRPVVQAESSATGARSRSGSHHFRRREYHATVSVRPRSKSMAGSQPRVARIFDQSRT